MADPTVRYTDIDVEGLDTLRRVLGCPFVLTDIGQWWTVMDSVSKFALLWGSILRSSLWIQESKETRLVWIAMLALKDQNGKVFSSVVGLADAAKVSVEECQEALEVLKAPDPNDTSKVEEGRRIREIPGGWEIINNDYYMFSDEAKRERWRISKAEQRAKAALEEEEKAAKAAVKKLNMALAKDKGWLEVSQKDMSDYAENGKIVEENQ